ncbi:hypothetical protein [Streptomyces pseudovenezuelae]|uniref:hypothetical protein n=1 Tax=Streptomyces pseudovenezuelae TaxID=67350 RepID=UPI002E30D367|nr:hypothetical protein [Streptomyces pseudovenezuelae]
MNARRKLIAALSEDSMGGIATLSDVDHAEQLADAYRAEVLREAAQHVRNVRQAGALIQTPVEDLLDEEADRAEGKASATAPTATPELTNRQARLLTAIRTYGAEWTTRRALHFFALTDPGVVQRGTARRDLATLHRAGHLVLVNDPDNRHYVLNTRKAGA